MLSQSSSGSLRTRLKDAKHRAHNGEEDSDPDSLAERRSAVVVTRVARVIRHGAERDAKLDGVERREQRLAKDRPNHTFVIARRVTPRL